MLGVEKRKGSASGKARPIRIVPNPGWALRVHLLRQLKQDPAAPSGVLLISEDPPTEADVKRTKELGEQHGW